ncbi:MAG: T3SS (YopN, CesT) and YbjN peptide-binding chaperone 1 [Actinomycetes bacterium]
MTKPFTDSLISWSELDAAAKLANALCTGDTGLHPGVQLSLSHGERRWTLVTPHSVVTLVGEDGGHGLERPVWVPCSALFWAAEAAQAGDACSFRVEHTPNGDVLTLAGVTASGVFELPSAPAVEPVSTGSLLPPAVVDVRVVGRELSQILHAAARSPRPVRSDERPPIVVHVEEHGSLSFGVNWEPLGGQRAALRLSAETEGNVERLRPLPFDPWALSAVADLFGEDEIACSFLADSTIALLAGKVRAVFSPVGGRAVLPPTLSDVLVHYRHEFCGTHIAVWVDGAKVRLVEFRDEGILRVSIELARSVAPSAELLEELNSLNARIGRGRLVHVRDRIYATVEVPGDDMARLPEVMGRLVDEVAPLGLSLAPFGRRVVGGRVVEAGPLTSEDLPTPADVETVDGSSLGPDSPDTDKLDTDRQDTDSPDTGPDGPEGQAEVA